MKGLRASLDIELTQFRALLHPECSLSELWTFESGGSRQIHPECSIDLYSFESGSWHKCREGGPRPDPQEHHAEDPKP